jgi:hypothetical protein
LALWSPLIFLAWPGGSGLDVVTLVSFVLLVVFTLTVLLLLQLTKLSEKMISKIPVITLRFMVIMFMGL